MYIFPGGTHFYHPHSHGAVSLQAGGGAVGMLIIEDNPFFEALPTRPAIYGTMPIQNLVFQYMDPVFTTSIARTSGDEVNAPILILINKYLQMRHADPHT